MKFVVQYTFYSKARKVLFIGSFLLMDTITLHFQVYLWCNQNALRRARPGRQRWGGAGGDDDADQEADAGHRAVGADGEHDDGGGEGAGVREAQDGGAAPSVFDFEQ